VAGSESLQAVPGKVICKAVNVVMILGTWNDARESFRQQWSQSERGVTYAVTSKRGGAAQAFGAQIIPRAPDATLATIMFALLGFRLALILFLLSVAPFLPVEIVMFILSHYILEVCNFLFDFTGFPN
jgi:hypothetical protein